MLAHYRNFKNKSILKLQITRKIKLDLNIGKQVFAHSLCSNHNSSYNCIHKTYTVALLYQCLKVLKHTNKITVVSILKGLI